MPRLFLVTTLKELKPEEAESGPAWSIKNYGDEGVT